MGKLKTAFLRRSGLRSFQKEGIQDLCSLGEDAILRLKEWFLQEPEPAFSLSFDVAEELAGNAGEDADTLFSAMFACRDMLMDLGGGGDTPEDLVHDLDSLGLLRDEAVQNRLLGLLRELLGVTRRAFRSRRKWLAANAGAPVLISEETAANLRPVMEQTFAYSREKVEDYAPTPFAFVPVGLVELRVSSYGSNDQCVSFQVDLRTLDRLVTQLLALQKEMLSIEEGVGTIQEGGGAHE